MPKPGDVSGSRQALFLSPEAPYPAIGGGALRSASLLEYLVQRYAVDLIVFRQPGDPDPRDLIPGGKLRRIFVLDLPFHSKSARARAVRNGVRLVRGRPPLLDRFSGFGRAIETMLNSACYDLGIIEHFWCAPYARQLRPRCQKLVLDLHNIESIWHARLAAVSGPAAALVHKRFAGAYAALERSWLPWFDELLVTSVPDSEAIRALAGPAPLTIYPNALPLIPRRKRVEDGSIIFSGNLEYQPNISAVRFFGSQVWPILRKDFRDIQCDIVGKNPHAISQILDGNSGIRVIGPVEDAVATIARAQVAIVPLLAGSGTRVKILEAWAAATPVVSTTIGAEGLGCVSGQHLLIADGAENFAGAVGTLLNSTSERIRIGEAGRSLYETAYTWEVAWRALNF